MSRRYTGRFYSSLSEIPFQDRDVFSSDELSTPFNTYAFLALLEKSGSVGGDTGWLPYHLVIFDEEKPCAWLPLYRKSHSYGEYVFDHSWANAFYQHGLDYYPKLLSALPFTPVSAGKLLIEESHNSDANELWDFALSTIWSKLGEHSSMHVLFVSENKARNLEDSGYHIRKSIQFIFYNRDFESFDDFLSSLKSRKRKSISKERKQITNRGVTVERLTNDELSDEVMQEFYYCYQRTYMKRSGHTGYLTRTFFEMLTTSMRDNIMLVKASKDDVLIASALFFYDDEGLYGRYWGALEEVSGLHFECCYYQGIEFAIEKNLKVFNPGTQGEHKILRGFTPTYCYSAHKLYRPDFDAAIADFTKREAPHIDSYMRETTALLPYKVE